MTLTDFIRLLLRNWKLLVIIPAVLAVSVFFFTRNGKKTYTSDTSIYTGIASGYTLTGSTEADFFTASNAFDNLISIINSRETKEEVAFRLLASHLMQKRHDLALMGYNAYLHLNELIPAGLRRKLVAPTLEQTVQNIRYYCNSNNTNEIYKILNSEEPAYSINALSKLAPSRLSSSDLIKITYETEDPIICRNTLDILTQVFIRKHRQLREVETASVIRYFEEETQRAKERLTEAENRFQNFNRTNDIINYEEQSKNIASEKENLYTDYNIIQMQYAGALSALKTVESRLTGATAVGLNNAEMLEARRKLAAINTKIAQLEVNGSNNENTPVLAGLRTEADKISQSLRNNLDRHYAQTNSIEGIPTKELLDEWVKNVILVEESKAKLKVMDKRKVDFLREYQKMAPLGATLKRIEREIGVAEQNYLSLLQSLHQSRVTQQNNELTAQLKIVDPPYLPLKPKSSKRFLLILLSAMAGFVFTAATVIGLELLDYSLKKPSVAAKQTGFPVFGIFPALRHSPASSAYEEKTIEQLTRQLLLKVNARPDNTSAYVAGFMSSLNEEGKTTVSEAMAQALRATGVNTLTVYPEGSLVPPVSEHTVIYNPIQAMAHSWQLEDLIGTDYPHHKIILVEFPALLEAPYPIALLQQLDLILVTIKANRIWRAADRNVFANILKVAPAPAEVLLNGVLPRYGEEIAGEIPQKRSQFRRWAKHITRGELSAYAGFKV